SKKKYLEIGETNCKIELIGMPKFDEYVRYVNTSSKVRTIGIAYNILDDLEIINDLIDKLDINFPHIKIILRSHPSDKRILSNSKIIISDSRLENSFEFLKQVDLLIASNSSIHLEAVLMNVFSISFSLGCTEMGDYYG